MRRFLWLTLLLAAPAVASPTGLNTIPTADLVPTHEWTVSLQNGNTALTGHPTLFSEPLPIPQFQFGLTPYLEGGVDLVPLNSPGDYRPQFNLKWKALQEDYHRPAVATGIATLGPGFDPSAYVVVSRTLNFSGVQYNNFRAHRRNYKLRGRRIHAGLITTRDGTFPFVGADWEMSDHFVLYADWISGDVNAATLGGVYTFNTTTSVTAAMLIGNASGKPDGFLVNFSRTFKW
jgi:hypothetical protein